MQRRPVNSCYSLSHIGADEARPTTYGLFLIVEQAATATTPALYSIELSDGYVNSGNLISGMITLH